MITPGTIVRLIVTPPWVDQLPEESRKVFEYCVGRSYRVEEIDSNGLLVLDVSSDVDTRFGGLANDLRVEAQFVEEVVR